jgi:hypothetical protein
MCNRLLSGPSNLLYSYKSTKVFDGSMTMTDERKPQDIQDDPKPEDRPRQDTRFAEELSDEELDKVAAGGRTAGSAAGNVSAGWSLVQNKGSV